MKIQSARELCTPEELARLRGSAVDLDLEDGKIIRVTVEHPARLHKQFSKVNREEHGWTTIGEPEDIGDGFVRVTMERELPSTSITVLS